jgi:hypothetical protein
MITFGTRTIWIPAHQRRLPTRNSAPHDELRAARVRDIIRLKQMEEELALQMEAELERIG